MSDFDILLSTNRPLIETFFTRLGRVDGRDVVVHQIPVTLDALASAELAMVRAAVAVVDLGSDHANGVQICNELRARRPGLPTIALLCCSHSVGNWHLQALAAANVDGIMDLNGAEDQMRDALQSVARGNVVLHVQLGRDGKGLLNGIANGRGGRQHTFGGSSSRRSIDGLGARVVELVACGLPDREIADRLHLSPHTVSHQIQRLCEEVGARNRVALAAWAGRHGFYRSSADGEPPLELVPSSDRGAVRRPSRLVSAG